MAELVTLKDQKTGEVVYPVTTYKNVLNKKGSNILGYLDHQVEYVRNYVQNGLSIVTTEQEKIKNLEGSDFSKTSIKISSRISQIIEHGENVDLLEQDKDKIIEELNSPDNLKISEFTDEIGVKNIADTIASEKIFVKYCNVPPTYAPIKNTIKICSNGYAYVGISGVWYVIKLSQTERHEVITSRSLSPTIVTLTIDTDWINSISLWNNNKLLRKIEERTSELNLTDFSDILGDITITADLVYEADTLRFFLNNQEIEVDNNSYSGIFNNLSNGDMLEIRTYNSFD